MYLSQHLAQWRDKGYAVFNPHHKPLEELPVIWGFNNGGSPGWYDAELLSDDGEFLGAHICSAEAYMPHDLGIVEGSRPDRHETSIGSDQHLIAKLHKKRIEHFIVRKPPLPEAAPTESVSPTPQEDIGSVGERPRSRWASRKMNQRAKPNVKQLHEETQ